MSAGAWSFSGWTTMMSLTVLWFNKKKGADVDEIADNVDAVTIVWFVVAVIIGLVSIRLTYIVKRRMDKENKAYEDIVKPIGIVAALLCLRNTWMAVLKESTDSRKSFSSPLNSASLFWFIPHSNLTFQAPKGSASLFCSF